MAERHITEEALNEIQRWAVRRLAKDEGERVVNLIHEIHYLRKHVRPSSNGGVESTARRDRPDQGDKQQCQFIGKIGGTSVSLGCTGKVREFSADIAKCPVKIQPSPEKHVQDLKDGG